jgi:serralysin
MLNMKSSARSAESADDPAFSVSDDPTFAVSAASIYASFIPSATNVDGHLVFANGGTAASSSLAGSVVAVSSGGININLLFDSAAMAAPASFRAGIAQAASILASTISDKITVNLNIDYSGTGGGAAAGPDNGQFVSYSTVRSDLVNHATAGDTTFNALPGGTSVQGQSSVAVWNAQLKLFGIMSPNDVTTDDGSAYFATDINSSLLVGVALHELTHALGRIPFGPQPDVFDLFRFTSPGVRLFQGTATAPAAYFSVDGGATKLADFGRTSDSSDFLNSGVQGSNDPFNEFYTGSTSQALTLADKDILDALGFHLTSVATVLIESAGSIKLMQVGNTYVLNPVAGGTGPTLTYMGSAVVAGQFGAVVPIGAEQVAGGYDVAWKVPGANEFAFWTTDSNGNYTSNLTGLVSGASLAVESLETTFGQDLNGDGTIGVTASLIQTDGSTNLLQIANNYYMYTDGSGPELKYGGIAVTAGEFGSIAPVGAVQTSTGYDIAWKVPGTNQFTFWLTDSNGNYTSNLTGLVPGTSSVVESFEVTFHQDLNGDGIIGLVGSLIQTDGSTSLLQVDNNYYLSTNGSEPELTYGGAPVTVGEFGTITPIGAIQTSTGFDIAWKILGTNEFTFWATDSNGNYSSNLTGLVSGASFAVESLETTFGQDLNGDGTIGVTASLIQIDGSTNLLQIANNYYMYTNGSGPELKYGGAPVTVGEFGSIAPVGAIQTSTGYDIAWKIPGTNQFTFWATDSNGNYTSNLAGLLSGTDPVVQSFELTFHQDLNGDGIIGPPPATSPAGAQSAAALPVPTTFDGTTLTLATPSTFTGRIIGFTGDGSLAASDHIDLRGINFNTIHSSFDASTGSLVVSDGATAATLQFLGHYSGDSFRFADDGHGGTLVLAATQGASAAPGAAAASGQDTFVFAANFGQITIADFAPATSSVEINHTVFADIAALLAATHDDAAGNAVITDAAHDTITLQHVTTAQLVANQTAFHFV